MAGMNETPAEAPTKPEKKPAPAKSAPAAAEAEAAAAPAPAKPKPPTGPSMADKFANVLAELQRGNPDEFQRGNPSIGNPLSPRSAALLCAHLIFDLGQERAQKMTRAEARNYADSFTKRFPAAWGALGKQDIMGLERVLRASGIKCGAPKDYQTMAERLMSTKPEPL